jgi:hypothetical protein
MGDTGYVAKLLSDRSVNQGGIRNRGRWDNTMGWLAPAVVLSTYYTDDEDWQNRGWASNNMRTLACDVRVYGARPRKLTRVPVCQSIGSLFDEDTYTPRPSRQNIDGGTVVADGEPGGASPTPAHSLDGDHVIVGFLECDPRRPIILPFSLGHPNSKRPLEASAGRVRRIRHAGVSIEWSEDGNLTIDASEAAKEVLAANGTEDPNNGTGGIVTIRTKDGGGDISRMVLDASGDVIIEDGGGTEQLELDKAFGISKLAAAAKVRLDAPAVELSTAPLEPVIKAATYNAAERVAMTAIDTYTTAVGVAMDAIAAKLASQLGDKVGDVESAGSAVSAVLTTALQFFTNSFATWTSAKVTTG